MNHHLLKIFPIKELTCHLYDRFLFYDQKDYESIDVAKKGTEVTWKKKISFYKITKEYESDDDTEIADLYSRCWTMKKRNVNILADLQRFRCRRGLYIFQSL